MNAGTAAVRPLPHRLLRRQSFVGRESRQDRRAIRYTVPMCGRYALAAPHSQLSRQFALDLCAAFAARYNIAPTSEVPVVRASPTGQRTLALLRWGLLPRWAKDPAMAARLINARVESLLERPAFREAYRRRRCLIPASGFYEWQAVAGSSGRGGKQPWYFSLKSGEAMAFAGLWESWTSPDGAMVHTCCIVTTEANALIRQIHERMPLMLPPENWQQWLAAPLAQLATPLPVLEAELQAWPVDRRVGRASEDDAHLIEAVA